MKDIKYYIKEALKINSKSKVLHTTHEIDIPIYNDFLKNRLKELGKFKIGKMSDEDIEQIEFHTIKVKSLDNWIVYKDKYRGDKLHIDTAYGFKTILFQEDIIKDFENFKPEDIVFTSDSLLEVVKWCFEKANIQPSKSLLMEIEDFEEYEQRDIDLCEKVKQKINLFDSEYFLYDSFVGYNEIETQNKHHFKEKDFSGKEILKKITKIL